MYEEREREREREKCDFCGAFRELKSFERTFNTEKGEFSVKLKLCDFCLHIFKAGSPKFIMWLLSLDWFDMV